MVLLFIVVVEDDVMVGLEKGRMMLTYEGYELRRVNERV